MKTQRAFPWCRGVIALVLGSVVFSGFGAAPAIPFPPDLVVAADGMGNFKTINAAVQSIPKENRERRIIFVKNGVYRERVRVDAACVTIRGESRAGTRLEFSRSADDPVDELGRSVLELSATANDFVLENFTVENTHGVLGVHAFTILGRADRVVIQDCDVLSQGNDTLSLWRGRIENSSEVAAAMATGNRPLLQDGGRYYHARLRVQGSVDFICPRGWCYLTDSTITQMNEGATAAMWHDGRGNADKKFVLRNCRFDGPPDWYLARHHHDAQFYFIDCTFSAAMRNKPPYRVIYPLNGAIPTTADLQKNQELERTNVFGERSYFHGSHRAGADDYDWHRDNLASAPGAPKPEQITAKWTFAGTWDPERTDAPAIHAVRIHDGTVELEFGESVTVKGSPRVMLTGETTAEYRSGSGTSTLVFEAASTDTSGRPVRLELNGGAIFASEAATTLRMVDTALPSPRHRMIVSTDIGGTDFDDFQSLVHLLVYADSLDLEGMISSPYGGGRKEQILKIIDRYERDYPNLKTYSDKYPMPDALRAITKQGGLETAGYAGFGKPSEGSEWIVTCARRDDPRPLHILVWGGIEDLAQALHDAPDILPKLRVYFIGGPNLKWSVDAYHYLATHHRDLWIIEANETYMGWFIGGNQSGDLGNETFVATHIAGHGALGEFFAKEINFNSQTRTTLKMGDSPSLGRLLRGNPADPTQPGWGGQFVRAWERAHKIYPRLTTVSDTIEQCGVFELALPLGEEAPPVPEARMQIENQALRGTVDGAGAIRFRFSPKDVKAYSYTIRGNIPALEGKTGALTSVKPPADAATRPSPQLPNWWTDNPAPEFAEGPRLGAKTVNRWREEYLMDFAARMRRCQAPAPGSFVPAANAAR